MKIPALAALAILIAGGGCKKDKDPEPGASTATTMAANGSGFRDVFSADFFTKGAGGQQGYAEVPDFTVQGDKLHVVYAAWTKYQQGPSVRLSRRTVDLSTGAAVALPAGADTAMEGFSLQSSDWARGPTLFLPYRNFFTHSKTASQSGSLGKTFSYFYGDLKYEHSAYARLTPGLGFRYPVHDITNLVRTDIGDGSIGFVPPIAPGYSINTSQPVRVSFQNNSANSYVSVVVMESYRHSFQDSIYGVAFRQDSIIAYTVSADASGNRTVFRKVAGIASFAGVPAGVRGDHVIRHYDPAGNKLAVGILGDGRTYSFTFDFTTHALARGVDFAMPHSDVNNADVDEEGNMYYADKSSGTRATTVYKRTVAGATSIVGAEKPLRYGEIVRVKYLLGKVYIGAWGLPDGADETHVAVLRQQ